MLIVGVLFAGSFFIKSNSKSLIVYETESLKVLTIENKIVATGKVVPQDEVEIKPQIAGIIDKILVKVLSSIKATVLLLLILFF